MALLLNCCKSNSDLKFPSDRTEQQDEMLKKFKKYQKLAEIYYVYHSIQRYTVGAARKFEAIKLSLMH